MPGTYYTTLIITLLILLPVYSPHLSPPPLPPSPLFSSGVSGSGKSFTSDQLLVKMFQNTQRTDWLQDIRKVGDTSLLLLQD